MEKIGLGGGCHWCTEAVFQSLIGVKKVEQGFASSKGDEHFFSEAVIVHYDSKHIQLKELIEIHLHTHKSTSNHSMRIKYLSAIYVFDETTKKQVENILDGLKKDFDKPLVTKVLHFGKFKESMEQFQNYYLKNPKKPFCETYISPKLTLLRNRFSKHLNMASN